MNGRLASVVVRVLEGKTTRVCAGVEGRGRKTEKRPICGMGVVTRPNLYEPHDDQVPREKTTPFP